MAAVITRFMGGLGNQLFQYAAGYALARHTGAELLIDRTFLDARPHGMAWTPRSLELDALKAPLAFATTEQVERMRRDLHPTLLRRQTWYRESGKTFNQGFFDLHAPVLIEGFWQCEQYFLSQAAELRDELFTPRDTPSSENAGIRDAIVGGDAASLHVRRGDYVTNPEAARFHGLPGIDYYVNAAQELHDRHGVERFFIFSDDPTWVRENLPLPFDLTFVLHNEGRDSHWDLWLMKHCRHHIIANSSFSWWGAWLDPRPDKVVIAPKQWFAGDASDNDIIPGTWLRR